MKKVKTILLLIIFLLPVIVSAHNIEELDFKWKTDIYFDGAYDENHDGKLESIHSNDYLYMTLSYDNITWIDKLTGDTEVYTLNIREIRNNENNEMYIFGYRDNNVRLLKIDSNLDIENTIILKNQNIVDLIIKDEKIIAITYKTTDNKIYEYLINVYDQDLNLLENTSTTMPVYLHSCGDKNYSFRAWDKYYYLNEEYKIVPYIVKENGDYTIFDGYKISNVDKNGNITKEYQISTSNYSSYYRETPDKKYVLINKSTYTTSNQYNSEVILYVFDDELNLLTQKVLGTKSNHYYYNGISGSLYLNKNEIVIHVDGKYYKLDSSYNLIETTSSEAKNSFQLSYEEYDNSDNGYYEKRWEIEEKLENYAKENISEDTNTIFDFVEYDNNYYATVTWLYNCYEAENNYSEYCYVKEDIVKFDQNFTIKEVKNHTKKRLLYDEEYRYGFESMSNRIQEFNGYLIVAAGGQTGNTLKLYDTDFNVIKDFNDAVSDSMFSPEAIHIEKNGFVLISQYYTPPPTNIENDTMRDIDYDYDSTEFYYFEFPYEITTEVTGKGTIEVSEDKTRAGEHVKFTVTPEKGYVLSEVKVTDSAGNVLIFTDYEFTMPTADVLIEAKFVPEILENPATKDSIIIIVLFLMSLYFINKHIRNTKKELI